MISSRSRLPAGKAAPAPPHAPNDDIRRFVTDAVSGLAAEGKASVARLTLDGRSHRRRSSRCAAAIQPGAGRSPMTRISRAASPGVQLLIDVTETLLDDARVARADSCATAGSPDDRSHLARAARARRPADVGRAWKRALVRRRLRAGSCAPRGHRRREAIARPAAAIAVSHSRGLLHLPGERRGVRGPRARSIRLIVKKPTLRRPRCLKGAGFAFIPCLPQCEGSGAPKRRPPVHGPRYRSRRSRRWRKLLRSRRSRLRRRAHCGDLSRQDRSFGDSARHPPSRAPGRRISARACAVASSSTAGRPVVVPAGRCPDATPGEGLRALPAGAASSAPPSSMSHGRRPSVSRTRTI